MSQPSRHAERLSISKLFFTASIQLLRRQRHAVAGPRRSECSPGGQSSPVTKVRVMESSWLLQAHTCALPMATGSWCQSVRTNGTQAFNGSLRKVARGSALNGAHHQMFSFCVPVVTCLIAPGAVPPAGDGASREAQQGRRWYGIRVRPRPHRCGTDEAARTGDTPSRTRADTRSDRPPRPGREAERSSGLSGAADADCDSTCVHAPPDMASHRTAQAEQRSLTYEKTISECMD